MKPNDIIIMVICGLVLVLLVYTLVRQWHHQSSNYVTIEDSEAVDGERTTCANEVLHVVQYWLQNLVSSEPEMSTSPDGQRSYVVVQTVEGHIHIQFNWLTNHVYLKYTRHSVEESLAYHHVITLKIKHGCVDEVMLAKYVGEIAQYEHEALERKILNSAGFKTLVANPLKQSDEEESENGGE